MSILSEITPTNQAIAARPKTTLAALVILAFLCGAAAGAAGMRRHAFHVARQDVRIEENKKMALERWRRQLDLSNDQVAQLQSILNDFDKYYDNVVAEGHERILQVLTPDQRKKFDRMLHERY